MREVFLKYTTDDRVSVSEGTFDETGVESGWADLVVIAQVCVVNELFMSDSGSVSRHFTGA